MPHPNDAPHERALDNFYHCLQSMAPFGVWLPWREVVTLAGGHGYTEELCFRCADTWLQLDALEFDPPRRSGDRSRVSDVRRIRLLYKPDRRGDEGVVAVSSDEDVAAAPPSVDQQSAVTWRKGVLQPNAGVEVDLPLPEPLDEHDARFFKAYWHLYSQYLLDRQSRTHNLAPDIPQWAWDLFSDRGFQWTTARVEACQQSLLADLQVDVNHGLAEEPDIDMEEDTQQHEGGMPALKPTKWGRCMLPTCNKRAFRLMMGSRGPFLVCGRRACQGKRNLTEQEWSRLPRQWLELWPQEWSKVSPWRRPHRPVSHLKKPRRRCPRSRKKPPRKGTVRHRPAVKKAPRQKLKKGFLQLQGRQVQKKPAARSMKKKPAARVYTPDHQRTVEDQSLRETRRVASKTHFTLEDLQGLSETQLTLKLLSLGFLSYREVCPLCGSTLSKPERKMRRQRCQKKCHNWITLWTKHPIFAQRGTSFSWKTQAAILCLVEMKSLLFVKAHLCLIDTYDICLKIESF